MPAIHRRRLGAAALTASALIFAGAASACAHVVVTPSDTAAGTEIAKLTFRVPTESVTAGTSALTIDLPTATPFAEVLAEPVPGWKVSVKQGKLPKPVVVDGTTFTQAPVSVTWTADRKADAVPPGEFQEFALSAGPIPDARTLAFPAIQTYTDGTVVKWDQPQPPGAAEPENPVPSFDVTPASAEGDNSTTTTSASNNGTAIGLGIAGLVAGLLGLVLGGLAWRKAGTAR